MFCPKCGSQVGDGLSFCPNCGSPLHRTPAMPSPPYQQQAPVQQEAYQQQPYPQQVYQQQASYSQQPFPQEAYPQQAYPQEAYQQQPYPQQHGPKRQRRWPIVVAAVVAVAAVAAVVVFVVLPRVMPKGIWIATSSSTTTTDSDGTYSSKATHTLDDRGNTIAIQYEDVYVDNTRSTEVNTYNYDSQGFVKDENCTYNYESKSSGTDSDTVKSTSTYQWTLGNGNKPKQFVSTTTGDNGVSTNTKSYEYGSDGHISKTNLTSRSEDTQGEYITEYDSHGLLIKFDAKSTHKDTYTKKLVQETEETVWKYEFDQSDRPISFTSFTTDTSTNKKLREHVVFLEYDKNGNLSTEKYETTKYTDDGPKKSTSTTTFEYKYVENPTPWVVEMVRLGEQAFSGIY